MKKVIVGTILTILLCISGARAQVVDISLGGDLVSSYIWRGEYAAGASVQPSMLMKVKSLILSAWGSVDIYGGGYKEVDFAASYSFNGLLLAVTDYWWEGEGAYKYFSCQKNETAHHIEGTIGYIFPFERLPLSIRWNTMFAGSDSDYDKNNRLYSTYVSGSFPFFINDINMNASIGISPYKSMYSSGFSVVDISLKATKLLSVTSDFQLPVFSQVIVNPSKGDIFFIIGISI